jgi:hypothetical protein
LTLFFHDLNFIDERNGFFIVKHVIGLRQSPLGTGAQPKQLLDTFIDTYAETCCNLRHNQTYTIPIDLADTVYEHDATQGRRIGISEIHDDTQQEATSPQAVAAITLPVFIRPEGAQADGRIESSKLEHGKIAIAVSNHGQAHMFVKSITLRGLDALGGAVFEIERNGWYVLAGDRRDYQAVIAGKDCRRSRRLTLEAGLLDGGTFNQVVEISGKQCGNAERTEFLMRASHL